MFAAKSYTCLSPPPLPLGREEDIFFPKTNCVLKNHSSRLGVPTRRRQKKSHSPAGWFLQAHPTPIRMPDDRHSGRAEHVYREFGFSEMKVDKMKWNSMLRKLHVSDRQRYYICLGIQQWRESGCLSPNWIMLSPEDTEVTFLPLAGDLGAPLLALLLLLPSINTRGARVQSREGRGERTYCILTS